MEFSIHNQVLLGAFFVAAVMGAVVNKTNFCTMGAVSDWVNMGDTGRIRAWVFAMAVALLGVLGLEAAGVIALGTDTFPPYRTSQFAWSRYIVGGLLFGVGMTLASGCGNKTLVRVGQGNIKSLVVLTIASGFAYLMAWTSLYEQVFLPWAEPTTIDLANHQISSQELSAVLAHIAGLSSTPALHLIVGVLVALGMLAFAFKSTDFRRRFDNILGGTVVGFAIIAGWWLTGGPWGVEWKEFAAMSVEMPSRVATQSYTFMSPMGDTVRYVMEPTKLGFVNFGVVALAGVIVGSFTWAIATRRFRVEWFVDGKDFLNHALGGVLMGIGGPLSMGCTIGQAITGVSTLAIGSLVTFVSIVIGAAGTMKFQYWWMMREG